LRAANLVACRTSCESFSALIAAYRPSTVSLTVATAGHPAPIFARRDFAVTLPVEGLLLGVDADAQYHDVELPLFEGDRILLYTDGLIEAQMVPTVSEEVLKDQLSRNVSVRLMVDTLVPPEPSDDVGVLLLKYSA
ncbi:MAG: PP2C family protein-serine/threonine phosphatase, partial [Vulcanimicrobiaceae bacterium]